MTAVNIHILKLDITDVTKSLNLKYGDILNHNPYDVLTMEC